MSTVILLLAVLAASAVEMVEAVTIVLAAGVSRNWRSSLEGAALALVVLAVLTAVIGPALTSFVPIDTLRIVIGVLLLVFGLQWLRKAILRATGNKALHDEAAIYAETVEELTDVGAAKPGGRDALAFTISFKGVFLEGVEVIFIVLTLGASSGKMTVAAAGAAIAALLVGVSGFMLAKPLTRVPENNLKLGVGLMLCSFGTFWVGEGLNVEWPGADAFILALVAVYGAATALMIALLRRPQAVAVARAETEQ